MHRRRSLFAFTSWGLVSFSIVLFGANATVAQAPNAKQSPNKTQETKEFSTPGDSPAKVTKDDGFIVVRGRVVNGRGAPVHGARLWLPLGKPNSDRMVKARSNAAGEFELPCPKEWCEYPAERRSWIVWAHTPGFGIQTKNVGETLIVLKENVIHEIQLPPNTSVRYKLLDSDGRPLSGVQVSLRY